MKPLIYFSYGMTKSGSTLAYQMASVALEQAGFAQPSLPAKVKGTSAKINFVQHLSSTQISEICDIARNLGHPIVLKTHTRPDPAVVEAMQDGRAIAHACYRDPRDMALSMLDHGERARASERPAFSEIETLEDAKRGIRNQCDTLTAWLRLPNVMPLCYHDIAFDSVTTIQKILDQLSIEGNRDRIRKTVLDGRFIQFNKGIPHRHENEMTPETSREFTTEFAPFYEKLIMSRPEAPAAGNVVLPPPFELRDMNYQ